MLTTIDVEVEHQRIARRIFAEAGFVSGRTRIITGRALDVLPRLADGAYDLVFVDAEVTGFTACVDAALRLLRPAACWCSTVRWPAAGSASEHWIPALLPSAG